MTKKDLAQELRELADELRNVSPPIGARCIINERFTGIGINTCTDAFFCNDHSAQALEHIADRIEAEYDPKEEPDTLEKVAREMLEYMNVLERLGSKPREDVVSNYTTRLEALGVTFDE